MFEKITYNTDFDICGIILDIILIVYILCLKHDKTLRSKMFLALISIILVAQLMNIITVYAETFLPARLYTLNNLLAVIHILVVNFQAPIYCIFLIAMTTTRKRPNLPKLLLLFSPTIVEIFIIITSPFHHKIMYFLPDGSYHHGVWWNYLYVVAGFYVLYGLFYIFSKKDQFDRAQTIISLTYTIMSLIGFTIQAVFPKLFAVGFSVSLSLMMIFLSIRNPGNFVEQKIKLFNTEGFIDRINDISTLTAKEHYFLILRIQNIEALFDQFGIDQVYHVLREYTHKIMHICSDGSLYKLFNGCAVYFCSSRKELEKKLEVLKSFCSKPFFPSQNDGSQDMEYPFKLQFFIISDYTKLRVFKMTSNKSVDDFLNFLRFIFMQNYIEDNICLKITPGMEKEYFESADIQNKVKKAMEDESFEVFLQPIFDLNAGSFTSAEALIRLKDDNGTYIPPDKYIPQSEQNGDIVRIGEIVLKKVCLFIKETELVKYGINKVNVNLSITQCMQDNIVNRLISIIDSYSLPHELFRFEITESMIAKNEKLLVSVMNQFTNQGFELALDDYGTGYSNTARMMQYNYSEIKFDKSLINEIETNETKRLMVKHHISMLKETGNTTVLAEGVETKELVDHLKKLNCDYIQGFYYAYPMGLSQFKDFFKKLCQPA
ncbi:MAG: EAL domain-containing protein [Spirochaetaceae bacterium]|nr:EAL domain-containing protein [Spirochaetaceae bacterium]